jgi:Cu2+-exporting ATPase
LEEKMTTHAHHETNHQHDSVESHPADYCSCCRVCDLTAVQSKHDAHSEHDGHDQHAGHQDHTGHELMFRNRFWVCLLLSVPVLIYSPAIQNWFNYTAPVFPGSQWILPLLATVVFLYGGLPFLSLARWELRARKPGMMTLISLAISVAYFYSMATLIWDLGEDFFWELVTLIDIMLLGHWMEMRSVRQASGALDALAKLMPDKAEVIMPDGTVMEHNLSDLKTGDMVLIRPGANAPADGVVVDGTSDVNESMLTGESRPVKKTVDSQIIAGTINSGNGSLRVRLTAVGDDTALSGIMRLVQEAQQSKSETQLLADRAASWLFYVAVSVAYWPALSGHSISAALRPRSSPSSSLCWSLPARTPWDWPCPWSWPTRPP